MQEGAPDGAQEREGEEPGSDSHADAFQKKNAQQGEGQHYHDGEA